MMEKDSKLEVFKSFVVPEKEKINSYERNLSIKPYMREKSY